MFRDSGGGNIWCHSFGGAEARCGPGPTFVRSLVLVEPDLWRLAGPERDALGEWVRG